MKPLIGVTARYIPNGRGGDGYYINSSYLRALAEVGLEPYVLPWVSDSHQASLILRKVKGVLFTGGEDLHPSYYGERVQWKTMPAAFTKCESDMSYMRQALSEDKPFLAICLGFQEMNVACGGSLIQHVGQHAGTWHRAAMHGTLKKLLGKVQTVNHMHHQSIKEVGRSLKVAAWSDGLIEGLELPGHRMALGVQWHPEELLDTDQLKLFELLKVRASNV